MTYRNHVIFREFAAEGDALAVRVAEDADLRDGAGALRILLATWKLGRKILAGFLGDGGSWEAGPCREKQVSGRGMAYAAEAAVVARQGGSFCAV